MREDMHVTKWLQHFGYIQEDTPSPPALELAVAKMQKIYGLVIDGVPGPITQRAMSLFRCAHPDTAMLHAADVKNDPQTVTVESRWKKKHLTYAIGKQFRLGNSADVSRRIIRHGFSYYEELTGMTFSESGDWNSADIRIGKAKGKAWNFDGPGNVLAWAQMPRRDRQLLGMFDESEPWNLMTSGPGVIMSAVWMHELGHLFGLEHSDSDRDLMAPFYNPQILVPQKGDIRRLADLYGLSNPGRAGENSNGKADAGTSDDRPYIPGLPYGPYRVSGTMVLRDDGGVALNFEKVSAQ